MKYFTHLQLYFYSSKAEDNKSDFNCTLSTCCFSSWLNVSTGFHSTSFYIQVVRSAWTLDVYDVIDVVMVIRQLHVSNNRCLKWTGCVTPKLRTYSANYYQMDFLVPSHVLFPACLRPHWPFFFNIFEETLPFRNKETNFVQDYKTFLNAFAKHDSVNIFFKILIITRKMTVWWKSLETAY